MSDPVTNVEIEDVLSSIRKLVSDGDKARTRDPAPVDVSAHTADHDAESVDEVEADAPESKPEKLVLTPAFLVVENDHHDEAPAPAANDDVDETADEDDDSGDEGPVQLTDMVWEEVENELADDIADVAAAPQPTDRSELVATIAELEAAVSADVDEYEPDGSEMMAQTIAWPGATASRAHADIQDAEVEAVEPELDDVPVETVEPEAAPFAFSHREDPVEGLTEEADIDAADDAGDDVYADDDLDGLLEAGGVTLDEEALRALVSEVVREELTGPLGERITRNVRKLVRREIYRILSSQDFD